MINLQSSLPAMTAQLTAILDELEKRPFIQTVTLSTADGLAVGKNDDNANRAAAIASLMAAAAQQAQIMLDLGDYNEIVLSLQDNTFLVYHPFTAGGSRLLLTVLFNRQATYKRLLAQTVNEIKQMMENHLENYLWE